MRLAAGVAFAALFAARLRSRKAAQTDFTPGTAHTAQPQCAFFLHVCALQAGQLFFDFLFVILASKSVLSGS